jgi:membrane dipeptidase
MFSKKMLVFQIIVVLLFTGCEVTEVVAEEMSTIHKKMIVVDLHCDSLLKAVDYKRNLSQFNLDCHVDIPKLRDGGVDAQFFAAWIDPQTYSHNSYDRAMELIHAFKKIVDEDPRIEQAFCAADVEKIVERGKIAGILAIEGGSSLEGKIENLEYFYKQGVRYITITWNYNNLLADGTYGKFSDSDKSNGGLTEFGKKVVRSMNELGIMVDVSHLSEDSFWDVMECSSDPVIASHSNAWELCQHPRNLKDEQIIALAEKGGVIGVTFEPYFLNQSGKATIEDVVRHINYMVTLAGIDHVAVGSDFDGISYSPEGLENASRFPNLTTRLMEEGYTAEDIEKIMGGNILNVFKQVCG